MKATYSENEVLDVLLTVIMNDNRTFKGTPPPMSKRKSHIRKVMRLYDRIMKAKHFAYGTRARGALSNPGTVGG